jgi:hypothetical protein
MIVGIIELPQVYPLHYTIAVCIKPGDIPTLLRYLDGVDEGKIVYLKKIDKEIKYYCPKKAYGLPYICSARREKYHG